MAKPSVFPTGVTIYDKEKTYNGYTLFQSGYGATLIDMNGRLKKVWKGLTNPIKPLPGGQIIGCNGMVPGRPGATSNINLVHVDWDGNCVWKFNRNLEIINENGEKKMAARVHHDFERAGTAAGYYSPKSQPNTQGGNTLLLTHNPVEDPKISDKPLLDERIIEVDYEGEIIWEWNASEHFEEFGFDEAAKKSIYNFPCHSGDWIHFNAVSTLGKNKNYDGGDQRFHPDNIIVSSRQTNIVFIIDKASGRIVWRVGPDYLATPQLQKLGPLIGQHHAHMIPEGLPGAGHILVFDNGSFGGYGAPVSTSPDGIDVLRRHYSRVVEFDPVTLEIVWEYMKAQRNADDINAMNASQFFSAYISSAQRLPNGNTLITEGADGIVIEVTPEKDIVWEFVNPILDERMPPLMRSNIYRAYRVPYEWVPQLEIPEEVSIDAVDNTQYRVPNSFPLGEKDGCETRIKLDE